MVAETLAHLLLDGDPWWWYTYLCRVKRPGSRSYGALRWWCREAGRVHHSAGGAGPREWAAAVF